MGKFNPSPSVEARMDSFQESIEEMLWPEKRQKDPVLGDKVPGLIDRTTVTSYVRISSGYLPDNLKSATGLAQRLFPKLFGDGGLEIGPIPAGTPVSLLTNLDLLADDADFAGRANHDAKLLDLVNKVKHDLAELPKNASDEEARKILENLAEPLMDLSKCPDYIVNRGHYFGTDRLGKSQASSIAISGR